MARQALTIAGAVVGSLFGAPQLGFAIGSLIGNAVDPVQIQGPKIGDLQVQTSRDGIPRPIVFGVAAVAGNIIDRSEPKIVKKKERQGKGGPVTVTERVYMSFAIRVCEGPATSISRVWENEKLVYDGRPGSEIVKDSTKFLEKVTFYMGDEDQLPDPTLEALHGVGTTPAHRGTCYVVFKDKDLTDFGGAIPQYRFEVNGIQSEAVDPLAGFVRRLLHFNGADNSTSFYDNALNKTWSRTGTPYIDADDSPFSLGGCAIVGAGNNWLTSPGLNSTDFNATTADWCIEGFARHPALDPSGYIFVYFGQAGGISVKVDRKTSKPQLAAGGIEITSTTSAPVDAWYHFAAVRNGTLLALYIDGTQVASSSIGAGVTCFANGAAWIGRDNYGGFGLLKIAEFRITMGNARYTGAFTPPSAPFPNP